jgi:thiosulfate/3-mercaptopyruvate sulfurtransferase
MTFGPLVTTEWLQDNLERPSLKIIDGSWRMPGQGDAIENYRAQHIPGAVFFDIDAIADKTTHLPHMLPSAEAFEAAVGAMGIGDANDIVVYDEKGVFSAARVWWTFRAMGHENVAVLNGGLPKWLAEKRPMTKEPTPIAPATYRAMPIPALCASHEDVRRVIDDKNAIIVDARPADRFEGRAREPRAGLRSGHMPGAKNIPYDRVLTENGEMKDPDAIREIFKGAGADDSMRIVTTCGSGVTAALLSLALEVAGLQDYAVYDGSWSEWGDEKHDSAAYPVVIGES